MAQILVTRPGALNGRDKSALRKSGVVCVEVEQPESVKLLIPDIGTIGGSAMLLAALKAINGDKYGGTSQRLITELVNAMEQEQSNAE